MGVSTDGILFFGIDMGCDDERDWELPWDAEEYDGDWEVFVAAKLGVKEPDVPWEGNEEVFRKYWKDKDEVLEPLGCEICTHCSDGYPGRYVALKDKNLSAARGYPAEVEKSFLEVSEEQLEKLKEFCELAEIPWSEAKWYLASYWG